MPPADRPPPRLLKQAGSIHLHFWPGEGPATLVIFGPGRRNAPQPRGWWGYGFAAKLGWPTIAFSTEAQEWYPADDMARLLPEAIAVAGPSRITYGFSMGGYAALKYGRALGAQATLALSPQYSIDPADVPGDARAVHFYNRARHAGMAVRAEDLAPAVVAAFDPLDPQDGVHGALLERLQGLRVAHLRHAGHATPAVLVEAQCLPDVLQTLLAGDVTPAASMIRKARRVSPTFAGAFALLLEQRGRGRWAQAFASRAATGRTPRPERALEAKARMLRRGGRFAEEEALLRQWIAEQPEELEPRLRLATCCLALGDPARAVPAIRDAIAAGPVDQRLRAALVRCLKRLGRTREAVQAAKEAVAAAPHLPGAHAQLGSTLAWAGRHLAARRAFARALEIDPTNAEARTGLASLEPPADGGGPGSQLTALLERMTAEAAAEPAWEAMVTRLREAGRTAAAITAAELGRRAHPGSVGLLLQLATLRLGARRFAEAEADFRALTEAAPEVPDGWVGLTDALWRQRRFADGRAAAAAGAAAHPGSALLAARHAAYLLSGKAEPAAAEKEARRAIALNPEEESAYLTLADALWRQHRAKDALREIQAAAAVLPDSAAIAARLGHLLLSQNAPAAAADAFARAVASERASAHAWIGYSDALWRVGRVEEATSAARQGVVAHPRNAELRARLGQLLLASTDAESARDALAEAVQADPASEGVHLALADALWRQGRRAEAIAAAREAVAAVPDKAAVAARLGHLLLEDGAVEEAAAIFTRVTGEEPTLVAGWVGLCEAERLRKRIRPALEAYRRAIAEGADRPTQRMMRFRLFGELEE